jgi:hypothetical protein
MTSLNFSIDLILPARIMTLRLNQPLTERVRGIFLRVNGGWPARKADNLTVISEPIV